MDHLQKIFQNRFTAWKNTGILHIAYALLAEALLLGCLGFIGLFTLETLLPTFITVRLSLTKFFALLVLLSFVLALLGRSLHQSFDQNIGKKSPVLWIGLLWIFCILAISLYKFPPITIPIIIAGFFLTGFLFWKIISEKIA